MADTFSLQLSSPITEEQWDMIEDVNFDKTDKITFHTRNGKEVTFVKRPVGSWLPHPRSRTHEICSVCGTGTRKREFGTVNGMAQYINTVYYNYCPHCGADMRGDNGNG